MTLKEFAAQLCESAYKNRRSVKVEGLDEKRVITAVEKELLDLYIEEYIYTHEDVEECVGSKGTPIGDIDIYDKVPFHEMVKYYGDEIFFDGDGAFRWSLFKEINYDADYIDFESIYAEQ